MPEIPKYVLTAAGMRIVVGVVMLPVLLGAVVAAAIVSTVAAGVMLAFDCCVGDSHA